MELINASGWAIDKDFPFVFYYIGQKPLKNGFCKETYAPFSWVRFNIETQELIAARDHIGQESFYYTYQKDRFIFGSTLPDILSNLEVRPLYNKYLFQDCFERRELHDLPLVEETYFKGIYRLKPGHYLTLKNNLFAQAPYWELPLEAEALNYKNEEDYLLHFTTLLDESVKNCTKSAKSIAAEFSGGLDSSMVFTSCRRLGLSPHLYTQTVPSNYPFTEEARNVQRIIEQYKYQAYHHYVDAEHFDPIDVLKNSARLYASPPPYLLGTLAHNLHQKIVTQGHDLLLSGHGGDDLISLIFPPPIAFPQRFKEDGLKGIRNDLRHIKNWKGKIKYAGKRLAYSHLETYQTLNFITRLFGLSPPNDYNCSCPHYYESLKHYEYHNVQGAYAHEFLMRIEYDSVIAKSMGFRYAYPLLYPPLMEFCFRLPLSQKINLLTTRWLARRYLAKEIPTFNFKTKGGSLVPNTMQKCRDYEKNGLFNEAFQDLPYSEYIDTINIGEKKLLLKMQAYILKYCL